MKHPIILKGPPADWDAHAAAQERVVDPGGEVNWWSAHAADPGCIKCPGCGVFLWAEGFEVRCPDCGHEWETPSGKHTRETETDHD